MSVLKRILHLPINFLLSGLENLFGKIIKSNTDKPIIFIIGAPRSGTTLIYQVLTEAFNCSYFSNLHHYFSGFPALIEFLKKILNIRYENTFKSNYGKIKGLWAPSEAGQYWYRFFDNEYYLKNRNNLIKSLLLIQIVSQKPLIIKNTYNSLRLKSLQKNFPNAVFIHVKRTTIDNAVSIYNAREKSGNLEKWFSVKPHNYNALKKENIYKQILGQINSINGYIEKNSKKDYISINYSDICTDPNGIVNKVSKIISLSSNYQSKPISASFQVSQSKNTKLKQEFHKIKLQSSGTD